jgi:HEAT repeat protein
MCSSRIKQMTTLLGLCQLVLGAGIGWAQSQPAVSRLYRDFQSDEKTDQTTAQLLKTAASDEAAKEFLAMHLPTLIEEDPTPTTVEVQRGLRIRPVWRNAAELAGELKIKTAMPALTKWLTFSTSPGVGLGAGEESLADCPAGRALVNIGDPSIPSLQPLLSRPDSNERYHAAYVLLSINSLKAEQVLGQYADHGLDRGLAEYIRNRLEVLKTNRSNR